MTVASLSLRHLARRYGPVRAVDDLNLEVPDGAFVTLLGPVWLRQKHDPEPDRRPGSTGCRLDPCLAIGT